MLWSSFPHYNMTPQLRGHSLATALWRTGQLNRSPVSSLFVKIVIIKYIIKQNVHYAQTNINNINKTSALLQTSGSKDEPNTQCFCRYWKRVGAQKRERNRATRTSSTISKNYRYTETREESSNQRTCSRHCHWYAWNIFHITLNSPKNQPLKPRSHGS
jgi:hypothetical protein